MDRRRDQRARADAVGDRVGPVSRGPSFADEFADNPAALFWAGVLADPSSSDVERYEAAGQLHELLPPSPELAVTRREADRRERALPESIQELYKLGRYAQHPAGYFGPEPVTPAR